MRRSELRFATIAKVSVVGFVALSIYRGDVPLRAHEGHGGVSPMVRQVRVGDEQWRLGIGVVPADPLAGELVRIEAQAVELPAKPGMPERAFTRDQLRLRVNDSLVDLQPTETPSVFRGLYEARRSGSHQIVLDVTAGSSATGRFPLQVRAGPLGSVRLMVVAAMVVVFAVAAVTGWRNWRGPARRVGWPALLLGGLGIALMMASPILTQALAAHFLPERPAASVDWILNEPSVLVALPESQEPGSREAPHAGPAVDRTAAAVVARIVAAPSRTAEIIAPMTGRIIPTDRFRGQVGQQVAAGQTLTTLQPTYVLHDAVHLINQRWPILVSATEARWRVLEAEATLERLKLGLADGAVSQQEVQLAQSAAATAAEESDRWSRTLAMHDLQIKDDQPARMNITSPISGQVATARFTQGQLVYEGDPLFAITDLSVVWAEVSVPEKLVSEFRHRKTIAFKSSALPGETLTGTLQRIAAQLDPQTRTLSHFYALENPKKLLRIGMLVTEAPPGISAEAPISPAPIDVLGEVVAKPEFVAHVTAPIWGRAEFAHGRLTVGQSVKRAQPLMNLILELSADERYQMEVRNVEIEAAVASARLRKEQAELAYRQAILLMKGAPQNRIRQQQVAAAERLRQAATSQQGMFEAQQNAFKTVMQRRDPRITVVTAPISGVVTELNITPGELNVTGEFRRLCTIVDFSRVWIEARVFEKNVSDVVKGVRASFTLADGDTPRELPPPIAVMPEMDAATRTLRVIFEVENPAGELRIGMTTRLRLDPVTARTN